MTQQTTSGRELDILLNDYILVLTVLKGLETQTSLMQPSLIENECS